MNCFAEWDEPKWKTKHTECATILQSLRDSLVGRGTKIVVVLMQSSAPLADDPLGAERASVFCQTCELSPKSLFVFPCRSDHLQGYILRYWINCLIHLLHLISFVFCVKIGERLLRIVSEQLPFVIEISSWSPRPVKSYQSRLPLCSSSIQNGILPRIKTIRSNGS